MNVSKISQVTPSSIIPAPEGTTHTVAGKEFPVIGYTDLNGKAVPLVDIPSMSDYKWQLMCLQSRIENPELYSDTEDVAATIERLKKWLAEHTPEENKTLPKGA